MSVVPRSAAALPGPVRSQTFQREPTGGRLVNSTTPSLRSRDQNVPPPAELPRLLVSSTVPSERLALAHLGV